MICENTSKITWLVCTQFLSKSWPTLTMQLSYVSNTSISPMSLSQCQSRDPRSDRLFISQIRFGSLTFLLFSTSHGVQSWLVPSRINNRALWTVRYACVPLYWETLSDQPTQDASFHPGACTCSKFWSFRTYKLHHQQYHWVNNYCCFLIYWWEWDCKFLCKYLRHFWVFL